MKILLWHWCICYMLRIIQAAPWNIRNLDADEVIDSNEDPELIGGFYEGDMDIGIFQNALLHGNFYWPNNVVPYKIADKFDKEHIDLIMRAMIDIERVSCVRFRPAAENDSAYIGIFGLNSGCHSQIGYVNEPRKLNLRMDPLNKGCFQFGRIQHELLHALGFFHQQASSNRDDYVKIIEKNVKPGKLHNFNKLNSSIVSDFGVPYDYQSIMHYGSYSFSKNGEKTMEAIPNNNINIGQRHRLSSGDIQKLNTMYKCPL